MNKKYNVIIVGSGFSGIVAANQFSGKGLSVLMIDENIHVGGQLLRSIPGELGSNKSYKPDYIKKAGIRFIKGIENKDINILNNSSVIGIYDKNEILVEIEKKEVKSFNFEAIIFATGARERFLPFKGWTLPGIFSTGMSQVLMKSSGILPAKNIVVAGSGLFLFSAAYEILKNGGNVLSIHESTPMLEKIKLFPSLIHYFSKISEGMRYLSKIILSGVPLHHRSGIIEARGGKYLEELVLGKKDKKGKFITGKEKIVKTEALAVGSGFTPNIELPYLAGCNISYSRSLGGWVVDVNDNMETSKKSLYCAGEPTGIGGALKSINEGETASFSILNKFGLISNEEYNKKLRNLYRERKNHLQFSHFFNTLYGIREEEILNIQDETVICRCEDVTMEEIRNSIDDGFTTPSALKTSIRAGMGNCQGRTCGPIIYDLLNSLNKADSSETEPFTNRPPLKPVKIDSLTNIK
ncbi:MAG: NAD(P)/FAD-dependent oxidoreductase [Acidobacteriota bacterium]